THYASFIVYLGIFHQAMTYLRLMKYPGAKTVMLPDLIGIIGRSRCNTVVDVFGGSGLISLNLERVAIVYNDVDPGLYNLFLQIHNQPVKLKHLIRQRMDDLYHPGGKSILQNRRRNELARREFVGSDRHGNLPSPGNGPDPLAYAAETLLRFNSTFGGLGETYSTDREKSPARNIEKTLEIFDQVALKVRNWRIENLDFRTLIPKYDAGDVLFYLDPPYPGKKWYNFNFRIQDFHLLKDLMDQIKGHYILNIDDDIPAMTRIFGDPTFTRSYPNRNMAQETRSREERRKAFYLNFLDDMGFRQHKDSG
ncbi:DNA adenine methylase, partial [mine drainage metagenome]